MNQERLERIEEYLKAGHYTPEIAHELLDEVKRLRVFLNSAFTLVEEIKVNNQLMMDVIKEKPSR